MGAGEEAGGGDTDTAALGDTCAIGTPLACGVPCTVGTPLACGVPCTVGTFPAGTCSSPMSIAGNRKSSGSVRCSSV